jgi:hypothetical protein
MDLVQHIQIELCGQDGYVIGSLIADVDEHIGEHPEIGVTLAAIRAKYGAKVEATAPRGGG